jgi:hypothetical protein
VAGERTWVEEERHQEHQVVVAVPYQEVEKQALVEVG